MERNRPKTVAPPVISYCSPDCQGLAGTLFNGAFSSWASATWANANKAYFYPFTLYDWTTIYQFCIFVGTTTGGNVDVGIYDVQKNRLVSGGGTTLGTANTIQLFNIADTLLPPGMYLLAGVLSNAAATVFAGVGATDEIALPSSLIYEQATAYPLPDPCNPVLVTDGTPKAFAFGAITVPTF